MTAADSSGAPNRVSLWTETIAGLSREWATISRVATTSDPASWEPRLQELRAEHARLVDDGRWVSGPSDLLTVIGRRGDELIHSAIIAWLMTPTARHGFGGRILDAIVRIAWPDEPRPTGPVVVRREVDQSSARTGDRARADIVATIGDSILVIENKVWAKEGIRQCERLYRTWADMATDVRWLFLTPDGRPPLTTESSEAGDAWSCVSYRTLAGFLAEATLQLDSTRDPIARQSALQYLTTLSAVFGPPAPPVPTREGIDHDRIL